MGFLRPCGLVRKSIGDSGCGRGFLVFFCFVQGGIVIRLSVVLCSGLGLQ